MQLKSSVTGKILLEAEQDTTKTYYGKSNFSLNTLGEKALQMQMGEEMIKNAQHGSNSWMKIKLVGLKSQGRFVAWVLG